MGYAVTSVTSEGIKNAQTEHITFCSNIHASVTGVAPYTFYKKTHDLTDVDYLYVCCLGSHNATAGDIKVLFGVTTKLTLTTIIGTLFDEDAVLFGTIDCTSITGDQVVSATIDNSNAGGDTFVANFSITAKET